MRKDTPPLSVVVPVYGDEPALPNLLTALREESAAAEILVVGAEDNHRTRDTCEKENVEYLLESPCRGAQLDHGARAASGRALWFLHADAQISPGSVQTILNRIEAGAVGGCFSFRFTGRQTLGKALFARCVNLRTKFGGIPYGDQGLFFSSRVYLAAGGFPHQPLFEEVRLIRRARRLGGFECLHAPIWVSPRRWQRDGWIRRTLSNRLLALRYALGADPWTLAQNYHPRREPDRSAEVA